MRQARVVGWCGVMCAVALVASGCCGACGEALEGAGKGAKKTVKKKGEPAAEVITYAAIKDRKSGPSDVKPSGRSGSTLKTKQGVIEGWAEEVERRGAVKVGGEASSCGGGESVGDLFKNAVLELDREAQKEVKLSVAEEAKLGDALAAKLREHKDFKGRVDTAKTAGWRAYLARVAQPLLAEAKRKKLTYHFHVIDAPVVNAFAIPGGHIYFFTGLLENQGGTWLRSEAELAGILAHEISHIDLGHVTAVYRYLKRFGVAGGPGEEVAQVAVALARHPFSSVQEDEADANAVRMMTWAQYSPGEFASMWERWAKAEAKVEASRRGEQGGKKDPIQEELEGLLRSHSPAKKRACNARVVGGEVLEQVRFDRFYVGETNYREQVWRGDEQH